MRCIAGCPMSSFHFQARPLATSFLVCKFALPGKPFSSQTDLCLVTKLHVLFQAIGIAWLVALSGADLDKLQRACVQLNTARRLD